VRLLLVEDSENDAMLLLLFELRLEQTLEGSLVESLENLVDLNRRMARGAYEIELVVREGVPSGLPGGREIVRIVQEHSPTSGATLAPGTPGWSSASRGRRSTPRSATTGAASTPGSHGRRAHSMRQRALGLGGEVELWSEPGRGTRVLCRVPLPTEGPQRTRSLIQKDEAKHEKLQYSACRAGPLWGRGLWRLLRSGGKRVSGEGGVEREKTRILLVEDHASFRQALAFMFEREEEFAVVGQAGSLAEARRFLNGSGGETDVAVCDLALPDGDGFGLIEELAANGGKVITLVLSASLEPARFARAVEAGASGVLHKAAAIGDIVEAVKRLRAGEALLSPDEVIEMLRMVSRQRQEQLEAQRAIDRLTRREREVLQALAEGLDSKDIAEKLHITVETERTHMVNILNKLGVHSRLQALVFAARNGLVEIR
jgi:DNA-binding NarL/FixJ family response regulator